VDRREEASKGRWLDLDWHIWVRIGLLAGLFLFLFRHEIERLIWRWSSDPSWSHGFLIPLLSLYFVNQHKTQILQVQARPSYLGCVVLVFWIAVYVFNVISPAGYAYLRSIAMVMALGAVVLFVGGWRMARYTWLPVAYLLFAVPLPDRYYVGMTMPLRMAAAKVSAALLDMVPGVEAVARGAVIDVVHRGRVLEPALDVADACSGMRLLMAFVALGVAMAYIHDRPLWQRAVLLVLTVPIAILCNLVRVTATGFIYVLIDPRYAQGVYHDLLGFAMLPLALGIYGFLAWFTSNLFVEQGQTLYPDIVVRGRRHAQVGAEGTQAAESRTRITNNEERTTNPEERTTSDDRRAVVPAFLVCAVVLALCGVGLSAVVGGLGAYLKKEPMPLRRPLDQMDESALAPFRVVSRPRIEDTDVLKSLGTTDYIQWVFEDTEADAAQPARLVLAFVTYYGLPDRVPHVPEECYLGVGFQCLATDQAMLSLDVPQGRTSVVAKYLVFGPTQVGPWGGAGNVPVLYLFRVNGQYAANRDEARIALNRNIWGRHSYFSKVELVFNRDAGTPSKSQVVQTSQRLLGVLLPVLERDHWPLDALKR